MNWLRGRHVSPSPYPRPLFSVAIVLVCFVLGQLLAVVFSVVTGIGYSLAPAFLLGEVVPLLLIVRLVSPSVRATLRLYPVRLAPVAFAVFACLSFMLLQYNVAGLVDRVFPMPDWFQEFLVDLTRVRTVQEFLRVASGVIVAAAVAEELLFRGLLQGSLEHRLGRWRGIAICSLIFAVLHDPWRLVPVFFIGGLLGYLVSRGGSLYYGMVAHAVMNTTSVVGGNLFGTEKGGEVFLPFILLPIAALVFVVSILGFVRSAGPDNPIVGDVSGKSPLSDGE